MKTKILRATESAYDYPLLIKRILTSNQRFETNNCIVHGQDRFSYAQFNERVCQLANALTDLGVKAGDTVALLDWDSHRSLECFFAVPMIGAVLHTVNIRLSPEQILYTMNHAQDDLVLVHDDFVPIISSIKDRLKTIRSYIQLTDREKGGCGLSPFVMEYESLLEKSGTTYEFSDFDENSVATTFYTTGTTGNPKGVSFSHRQLVLHTINMANTLATNSIEPLLNGDSVYMPITPMFHVHAWGVPYVATMLGAQQIYPGRYDPDALVRLIREEGVTFSHCVPTILQALLQSKEARNTDFSCWKLLVGGSPLTQGLAEEALRHGIETFTGYGMSETCPLLSMTRLDSKVSRLPPEKTTPYRIKAGVPANLVDLAIWDSDGKPLPHDGKSTGEVVARAPWLTRNYLHDDENSEQLWQGGWLHTGDVASIHPDGFVEIRDRIKDVIKTGGEWISSLELESLISHHPGVASVAVIGVPDERWGERPHALVVSSQTIEPELIKQHLSQYVDSGRINKWAIPETIELVDDIPKTSVGKIDKKRIRSRVAKRLCY